jgi:hypothetical protein
MKNRKVAYICLTTASALVLIVGLGSAVFVYQTAENAGDNILVYEGERGTRESVMPQDSKKYLRDLELYGGKANVLATGFRLWLAGLWHGKPLAYILACAAILLSFWFLYLAGRLSRRIKSAGREGPPDRAGS